MAVLMAYGSTLCRAEIRTISIPSPSNGGELLFTVYLPPQYEGNPSGRFPTVYCLHGLSGNPISRSRQVVPSLDAAIAAGKVQPMIFVFPDRQRNSFYADAFDKHKQVHANIIDERGRNRRTVPFDVLRKIRGPLKARRRVVSGAVKRCPPAVPRMLNFQAEQSARNARNPAVFPECTPHSPETAQRLPFS